MRINRRLQNTLYLIVFCGLNMVMHLIVTNVRDPLLTSESDLMSRDAMYKCTQKHVSSESIQNQSNENNFDEKIDYHNYKLMAREQMMSGPGEQGSAIILSKQKLKKMEDLYYANGFQGGVSDMISLNRSLGEQRHPDCLSKNYRRNLPTVSLIIPFHQEHWSTLLRTILSATNRSPPHLIKEIILVDDFSQKQFLKKQLDDYVAEHFPGKVRIIRNSKREGLIRTRINGAKVATGDVLLFLDSHCECTHNWLPPLIDPIAKNYKIVTCPFIDVIDADTFKYTHQDEGARGAFNWELLYKRLPRLPEDKNHPAEPFDSPVMAGGLFAISSKWFWELGAYDPGLEIWGMEQYELSFKIWQCGGRMIDIPCSRVGHIYRSYAPFKTPLGLDPMFGDRNLKRVAEVWMDEYKEFVYARSEKGYFEKIYIKQSELDERTAIRKQLKCKPFKWYMENVAFDLLSQFPLVDPPPMAKGHIRNQGNVGCLGVNEDKVTFGKCEETLQNQIFEFTFREELRSVGSSNQCIDVPTINSITVFECHQGKGNQQWKYNVNTHQFIHKNQRCLDLSDIDKNLLMNICSNRKTQRWTVDNMNTTFIEWAFTLPKDN